MAKVAPLSPDCVGCAAHQPSRLLRPIRVGGAVGVCVRLPRVRARSRRRPVRSPPAVWPEAPGRAGQRQEIARGADRAVGRAPGGGDQGRCEGMAKEANVSLACVLR